MTLMQQQWKRLNAAALMRRDAMDPEYAAQRESLLRCANWNVWESARLRRELGARLEMGGQQ
jgi:hypothetical protein